MFVLKKLGALEAWEGPSCVPSSPPPCSYKAKPVGLPCPALSRGLSQGQGRGLGWPPAPPLAGSL